MDEKYKHRCLNRLKEWGAPLSDCYCVNVEDTCDEKDGELSTCELCGCEKVRYLHHMTHKDYFETLPVGCVCAGILEGDELAAEERDRKMRNRAKRKQNFVRRNWKTASNGGKYFKKSGDNVFINQNGQFYSYTYRGSRVYLYHGKRIDTFLTATYAAFDLVVPIEECLEC